MTLVANPDQVLHPDLDSLAEIDWDFPERVGHSSIEGIHPYPAKFVTELPRTLLNLLPLPHETAVLDPFCGSGTTLVESQRCGVPSVGVDLESDSLPNDQGEDLATSLGLQAMGKEGRVCG